VWRPVTLIAFSNSKEVLTTFLLGCLGVSSHASISS
jgi:hypothetical protein